MFVVIYFYSFHENDSYYLLIFGHCRVICDGGKSSVLERCPNFVCEGGREQAKKGRNILG